MAKTWVGDKEDELKQLNSELAALNCKITAELALKQKTRENCEKVKRNKTLQTTQIVEVAAPSTGEKESMLAEPITTCKEREPLSSIIIIGFGVTPLRDFRAAGKNNNH